MDIAAILGQMGGLQQMAKELGISEAQAASGASALAPAILGGIKKQAQGGGGLDALGGLLGAMGGGSLLDSVLSPEPTNVEQGNGVLGQIFGSKDVSRTVAQSAATQSGLDSGILKKMLPMVAMAVTGYMAKQAAGGLGGAAAAAASGGGLVGGLGGLIGSVLGGGSAPAAPAASGGGLASMIDMNGDGNALDDIMRMAGKFMK